MPISKFDLSVIFRMVDRFSAPMKQSMSTFNKWTDSVKKAESVTKSFGKNVQNMGNQISSVGKKMALSLTLPITLLGGLAVRNAIKSQSAFTGVRKTVKATEPVFQQLKKDLKAIARETGLATTEIFKIGETAGQLDIQTDSIASFAKVMADLGVTTNLTSDEAATALARFANITQMSQKDFDRLGSTIVELGNNTATTESEIVNMGMRLASAGKMVGLTQAEIMSLAATLSSLGLKAEGGGTAFSKVMRKINKAVGVGGKFLKGFALVSGQSVEEFKKNWGSDTINTVMAFTSGLERLKKEGINLDLVLEALKFSNVRISDSLIRASGAGALFNKTIGFGNIGWTENLSLIKEANLRYGTWAVKLAKSRVVIGQVMTSFGNIMAPVFVKFNEVLASLVVHLGELSPASKKIVIAVALLLAVMAPLIILIGGIVAAIGLVIAVGLPMVLMVGGIVLAFIALGAALGVVWAKWKTIKTFFIDLGGFLKFVVKGISDITGFTDVIKLLTDAFKFWADVIGPTISKWFEGFLGAVVAVVDAVKSLIVGFKSLSDLRKKQREKDNVLSNRNVNTSDPNSPLFLAPVNGPASDFLVSSRQNLPSSQTDVTIRVEADPNTNATIDDVKSKGDANVKVINDSFLGAGASFPSH